MGNWLDDRVGPPRIYSDGAEVRRSAQVNYIGGTVAYNSDTGQIDITLPDGAGGSPDALADIAALRAQTGQVDKKSYTVRKDGIDLASPQPATFVYEASQGANVADDGVNVIKPTAVLLASAGRYYRDPQVASATRHGVMAPGQVSRLANMTNVYNVLDYGAIRDGLDAQGATCLAGIQAAADAAAAQGQGGIVYFPAGEYRIMGGSIKIPRIDLFAVVVFQGEGIARTAIVRNEAGGLVFEGDNRVPSNANVGVFEINDMTIAGHGNRLFDWDFGDDTGFNNSQRRAVPRFRNLMWRAGTGQLTEDVIHFFGAQLGNFENVKGYGIHGEEGVLFWMETSSTCTFTHCGTWGAGGSLIKCTSGLWMGNPLGGGTFTFINCRGEGGNMNPEWYFESQNFLTFIGCSNEGKREYPAAMLFENCNDIRMMNQAVATADTSYVHMRGAPTLAFDAGADTITRGTGSWVDDLFYIGGEIVITNAGSNNGTYTVSNVTATVLTVTAGLTTAVGVVGATIEGDLWADGMKFVECQNVSIDGLLIPDSFANHGDASARGVRVDADCIGFRIESGRLAGTFDNDIDIDPAAEDWHVRVGTIDGLRSDGTEPCGRLLNRSATFAVRYDPTITAVPDTLCGMIVDRGNGSGGDAAVVWDETNSAFATILTEDEAETIGAYRPIVASEFRGPTGENAVLRAATGTTVAFNVDATLLAGFQQSGGDTQFRTFTRPLQIITASNLELTSGSTSPTSISAGSHASGFRALAGAFVGLQITNTDGTGRVAFYGATPVAKPTVTGSRGGNAALASLLTELANLGLIVDSTS